MAGFAGVLEKSLSLNLPKSDIPSPVWEYRNIENSFSFEIIDAKWWGEFMLRNRWLAFCAGGVYLVTIFGLKKHMENKRALDLRLPFICWNMALGIFSIMGFIRSLSYFTYFVGGGLDGFYRSVCTSEKMEPSHAFWAIAFCFSKYVELGDTVFIVLRKRPLLPIQWYHHIATLIVAWISTPYNEPVIRYFAIMNYGVHSVMYPYFAFKLARFDVPKVISNVITTAQFVQMIFGFGLNIMTTSLMILGSKCYRSPVSVWASLAIYGSFVILFGQLFLNSVLRSQKRYKNKLS